MASRVALDLPYWAMRSASYRLIQMAIKMASKVGPSSEALLEECGMHTIGHYIGVRRETIVKYVVGCSILAECQGADQRRGLVPRRWWWEQRMCLDDV